MKNSELLHQIIEIAGVLGEDVSQLGLSNSRIRTILAPALRLWSEHNGIYLVQKMLGKEFFFNCRDHKLTVRACEQKQLDEWASPIMLNGIEMDFWLESEPQTKFVRPKIDDQHAVVKLDSGAFFNQKLMFLNGLFLTRKDIIDYVANRMGGTHPVQVKNDLKENKFREFGRMLGFTDDGKNLKVLKGTDMDNLRDHLQNGAVGGDPFYIYVADAAGRFVEGINSMLPLLEQKLEELKSQNSMK